MGRFGQVGDEARDMGAGNGADDRIGLDGLAVHHHAGRSSACDDDPPGGGRRANRIGTGGG